MAQGIEVDTGMGPCLRGSQEVEVERDTLRVAAHYVIHTKSRRTSRLRGSSTAKLYLISMSRLKDSTPSNSSDASRYAAGGKREHGRTVAAIPPHRSRGFDQRGAWGTGKLDRHQPLWHPSAKSWTVIRGYMSVWSCPVGDRCHCTDAKSDKVAIAKRETNSLGLLEHQHPDSRPFQSYIVCLLVSWSPACSMAASAYVNSDASMCLLRV
ncbi:hypothetical protein P154DRAFT_169676 [Amniculicola lignicola CBS 123094]|uniref:Uncharacterized protein n=1 Tax=Amniculicola lignicola CBS 123094 TaxID=1392246 RepID=A0A6A5WV10_9PLEO|nr:hypothetical protein P154DRAFT_169676 [Amniculicola lignicola CBS 123094]